MMQYEAVVEAMKQNDGYASFPTLYKDALKIDGVEWGTKTPYASIRRIVQDKTDLFFRIRPGLWGLVEYKERIAKLLGGLNLDKIDEDIQFNHSYFQGLTVELGKLKGYSTHIPNQDRARSFLGGKTLGDLINTALMPPFSYQFYCDIAKRVDVVWFKKHSNDVLMPHAFLEIEYSTDFANSLRKFVDLYPFRSQFYIVSDENRRREFDKVLNSTVFLGIKDDVKYLNYEQLAQTYESFTKRVDYL
jgi:hypothetical protein